MVDVEVDVDEGIEAAAALSDDRRAQLLQIAREALSNAARHAGASQTRVGLVLEDGTRLRLTVEDNGRGFDPQAGRAGDHQGLANMRDRATHMGGELEVDSAPGMGVRIIVRVPLASGDPARD